MTDTIQSNPCLATFEKYGDNFYLFYVLNFAKVIEVVINACLIQTGQHIKASWVIMIPMNAVYWKFDTQ